MDGIDAAVAELTLADAEALHAILRTVQAVAVVAVAVLVRVEDHKAVLVFPGVVGVLAILVILIAGEERRTRNRERQLIPLIEERAGEIEIATECEGIPPIREPELLLDNFVRTVRMEIRHDRFPRQVACTLVQKQLIGHRRSPLLTTVHAECRLG